MFTLETKTSELDDFLSLADILRHLRDCDEENVEKGKKFKVFSRLVALITNNDYDPDGFSQEIEDSEKNRIMEEIDYCAKHPFGPEKTFNSRKWLDNNAKKSPLILTCGPCLSASGITTRSYYSTQNVTSIVDWFSDLEEKSIHVYMLTI